MSYVKPLRLKKPLLILSVLVLLLAIASFVQADTRAQMPDRPVPERLGALQMDAPVAMENVAEQLKLGPALLDAEGRQRVVVRLSEPSVAEATLNGNAAGQLQRIEAQQAAFIQSLAGTSAQVLGTVRIALNAVMLNVDAADLATLVEMPVTVSIKPVVDYELDLSETVPYIGGTAVQANGYDGSGVRVAVLDSGIDYYHANLGGTGDPNDYAADDPTIIEPGTFPTAKVVGGYDFVGELWPVFGSEAPDPDPLDSGPAAGHGTHVADIIGGVDGVAPGVDLYSVKVCSSVSTACSGVALIQGMDFALDPNGDGDISDRVDIVNMSLGASYGQAYDDDLSLAVDNASALGVLVVAAAGNGSDKPYVTGTPGAAPSALAVAQTQVPSAFQPLMSVTAPASIAGDYAAVFQPWSAPLTTPIEAPLLYGDGAGGNLNGCAPFAPGSLTGYIVLVDRGACFFSTKIQNIEAGGGLVGIIGLIAPGEPFQGGFGTGTPPGIPGYMISQADANALKSGLPNTVVRFDPANGIPLVMHMVGSSSRGPSMRDNLIKPEIGAPGASVSAVAGTGNGVSPFGGTSGATPMVAGSAALVKQAYPDRSPAEIKAVLVNTGETNIMNKPAFFGGDLAPITRIGGGEVRVDRAIAAPAAAWDAETLTPALSFGFYDITSKGIYLRRDIVVRNYTNEKIRFSVTPSFRFLDDELSGAIKFIAPQYVTVKANSERTFPLYMRIRGQLLNEWAMNSGSRGANPDFLTLMEYDGYITLTPMPSKHGASYESIHVPWQILPRQSGDVRLKQKQEGLFYLRNRGVGTTTVESYSLIGTSPNLPEGGKGEQNPTPDLKYVGYATYPVPAGFCSANPSFVMAFAVNTWERQTHALAPASFRFYLDVDQDGSFDFVVFNFPLDFGLSDGRSVTWVRDLSTGATDAYFYVDHVTNSGNTVLYFCGEQIGMDASNFFQPMDVVAAAADVYYQGTITDLIGGITISPLGEQYLGLFENGSVGFTTLDYKERDKLRILDFGPLTNNTETGLLLLYRNGAPADNEADVIIVTP